MRRRELSALNLAAKPVMVNLGKLAIAAAVLAVAFVFAEVWLYVGTTAWELISDKPFALAGVFIALSLLAFIVVQGARSGSIVARIGSRAAILLLSGMMCIGALENIYVGAIFLAATSTSTTIVLGLALLAAGVAGVQLALDLGTRHWVLFFISLGLTVVSIVAITFWTLF